MFAHANPVVMLYMMMHPKPTMLRNVKLAAQLAGSGTSDMWAAQGTLMCLLLLHSFMACAGHEHAPLTLSVPGTMHHQVLIETLAGLQSRR